MSNYAVLFYGSLELPMDLFIRVVEITFPIFSIVALGLFCGYKLRPDMSIANRLNMDVFCPALLFSVITGQNVDLRDFLPLLTAGFVVVLGSGLLIWPFCRWLDIHPRTLVPTSMFNNCGNMGLPLIALTFGESFLPIAVILFIVSNTLHFTLGMFWINRDHTSLLGRIGSVFSPITLVSLLAMLLVLYGISVHETILRPIDMLGEISIPLMLFALGVRLYGASLQDLRIGLIGALACPISGLIMVILVVPFVDLNPTELGALFLFSCLPPAVLNYMFAERFDQEPKKVASIVIVGNALSIITLPLILSYVLTL
jgi:predicted permease